MTMKSAEAAPRLGSACLPALATRGIPVPTYPRHGTPGVVHLGLGAFHRAHQADIALLDQVGHRQAVIAEPAGSGDNQAQISRNHLLHGLLVALPSSRAAARMLLFNADGSEAKNLTNTPGVDEMYPHVSPDGTKICFSADEMDRKDKVRNVYYMNLDGSDRVRVATNGREPCWCIDSKSIAYLKGEYTRYTTREYATAELMYYHLEGDWHSPHRNKELHHLYAICWSPDSKWFLAAIHGAGVEANVSLKLTQFGLNLGPAVAKRHLGRVLEQAKRVKSFVRVDMEGSAWTSATLDLVLDAHKSFGNVGTVLQAMLRRTPKDVALLNKAGVRVRCMHSDIETLERIEIIRDLRLGKFDVLVGINLLREGLDIPECGLVAILDADKEGFLRSETSLIQTIGRAARNIDGKVVLYADRITGSMERAMGETQRRRDKQHQFNLDNGITPESVKRDIKDILNSPFERGDRVTVPIGGLHAGDVEKPFTGDNFKAALKDLESKMREAASNLEFETAARLRDEIKRMKMMDLEFANEILTAPGEAVDKAAPKRIRQELRAEQAEAFRKSRL